MVNACDNINIVNNTFTKNGRHYIASGGMVGGTTVVGGLQRNCLIDGNSFYDANQEAVNTHIACRAMMRIVNNKFFRCLKAVELTNASSVIENNIFENCPIPVDLVESAGYHLVQGNQFIGGTKIDLDCECAFKNNLLSGTCYITWDSSGTTYPLEIAGNSFKDYADSGIYCTTTNTGRKVRILNNIYESTDGNKYFVRLTGHNNVDITGNTAYGGIQLNTCSGVNISNNTLRSGSSYSAIRLYDASGLHLIKNNVLGATNIAINLDGTGANAQAIKIRLNNITAATAVNNVSNYYSAVDDDSVRI